MADHDEYASDENTIIRSHRSSHPSVNALDPDEEIYPRTSPNLQFLDNNNHLDLAVPFEHKIIIEILRHHPILTALTKVELVPAIYLKQFWSTLSYRPNDRVPRFTAKLDHFDVQFTLRGLRRSLNLPSENLQIPVPESQLYADIRSLGYQPPANAPLTGSSTFRRNFLPRIYYSICSIFNRCMTSKHTGLDKTNLATLRMFHAFVFNHNIDYAVLIWNEMVELAADQLKPKMKRNFVPFQRFFQILIHQAMVDNNQIPRRADHPKGPSQYMHAIRMPKAMTFAHTAVLREDLLAYADQQSRVVREYRLANALPVHPEPEGPPHDAILLGGEGPIVEGVQEQGGVPEQRGVRRTKRKRVGKRRLRTVGEASSRRPPKVPTVNVFADDVSWNSADANAASSSDDEATNKEAEDNTVLPPFDDDDDPDPDPNANLIQRSTGKRPRTVVSTDESSQNMQFADTTTGAGNEGVEEEVEVDLASGEERGRKEMSDAVTGTDKVLTTVPPQTVTSRVATSTTNVRSSPLRIETDMVRPAMQCTAPLSHSVVSSQTIVSSSTGDKAQSLSATHSVSAGIETGRLPPRPPPVLQSTLSLGPFGTTSFPRPHMRAQQQVGSFRAPTGTPRVLPPFVGASRGQGGSPVMVNPMPAMNTGSTVASTATLTGNLSGASGDLALIFQNIPPNQIVDMLGPPPHYVTFTALASVLGSVHTAINQQRTVLQRTIHQVPDQVLRALRGKDTAESSSTPQVQPSESNPHPSYLPLQLAPEEQLKSELFARLLAKPGSRTSEDADLVSLLRQHIPPQPQPQPQPQASTSSDAILAMTTQYQKLSESISDMTKAFLAGFQTLDKRMTVVEERCGIQAEGVQKRRHDDQDPPDQHEGERQSAGVSGTGGTGTVQSEGIVQSEGDQGTGTGGNDTVLKNVEDTLVLADVIAGVEKPAAVDNRTEEERMSDEFTRDYIDIDSEEEPEQLNYAIKEEMIEALDELDFDVETGEQDQEIESEEEVPTTVVDTPTQTGSAGNSLFEGAAGPSSGTVAPRAPFIPDGKIKDRVLDAELRFFQGIVDIEPRYMATGQRVALHTPFLETVRKELYVREVQKINLEKVYGIENWPSLKKIEFLYVMKNESKRSEAVKSDNMIMKVLNVVSLKLSNVYYPEFTVLRSDGSESVFSEADFKSLRLNDLMSLFELLVQHPELKNPENRIQYRAAFRSVKKFMKNILKYSYLTDFQMALESFQTSVNLRKPKLKLSDIEGFPAYTVLNKPELGVVYVEKKEKKFMRVIEMNKFCEGTLRIISLHLESKLRLDANGSVFLTKKEKDLIKEVLDVIAYRKDYRLELRRFEHVFGLRKNFVAPVDA